MSVQLQSLRNLRALLLEQLSCCREKQFMQACTYFQKIEHCLAKEKGLRLSPREELAWRKLKEQCLKLNAEIIKHLEEEKTFISKTHLRLQVDKALAQAKAASLAC